MVSDIGAWLRKAPAATVIRCTCPDGVVRTIRVDGKSSRKWVDAEETIVAMHATDIEALDGRGHTLRKTELAGADSPENVPASSNERQSDLAHFATLLSRAHEQGARATEAPTKLAFETLGNLVQLVLKRLQDIESRQIRALNAAQRAVDGAAGGGEESQLVAMLAQFVAGANGGSRVVAAAQSQPVNGAPPGPDDESDGGDDDA
jgi:electron transfer flavoprotein alpha subunit